YPCRPPRYLRSFPTRRSSDLHLRILFPTVPCRQLADAVIATGARIWFIVDGLNPFSEFPGDMEMLNRDQFLSVRAAHIDGHDIRDRKSTRLNSSHVAISYAVF